MIDISKKRIALVGGAGFIGHHLALNLASEGAEVVIVDNLMVNNLLSFISGKCSRERDLYLAFINERIHYLKELGIPIIAQDAREYHALSRVLSDINPSIIIQLAAVAHANISNKDPFSTFGHSLRTLENTLDWARGSNVEHFVFFSSSMVYGNFPKGFVTEETPCEPLGIYGALKYSGEKIVTAYHQVFDLPYTIVRPSALYGERCVSRRVGQIFVENAMRGGVISINGDGSDKLDFTYIGDLVQGIIKVLKFEESKNEIFNLTFGSSRSISEMAEILRNHFPDVSVRSLPRDHLMPERGTLSIEKARKLLGYSPEFPLEKGLSGYINWYQGFFDRMADGKCLNYV